LLLLKLSIVFFTVIVIRILFYQSVVNKRLLLRLLLLLYCSAFLYILLVRISYEIERREILLAERELVRTLLV